MSPEAVDQKSAHLLLDPWSKLFYYFFTLLTQIHQKSKNGLNLPFVSQSEALVKDN